jgi:peptidoglycan pentaglycine glycine transferase (the first glycine)
MSPHRPVGRVSVRTDPSDPEWDAFLEAAPGGTHQQSSMWARVKAVAGWEVARVAVHRADAIVGGCQVLTRSLPLAGSIAYVPRGPVVCDDDPETLRLLLGAIDDLANRQRILYLKLQPPPDQADPSAELERRGFKASRLAIAPRATVRVHLGRPPETLLREMHHKTRRNIRRATEQGVKVRDGGEADLETFAELVRITAERQGFTPYPPPYYERMWQVFAYGDRARLLIAEHEGVPLAANFLICFAGTVTYKMGAWSGARGSIRPNELLHWAGMDWARRRNQRFYDFDDLELEVAEGLRSRRPPPILSGLARFKLGFGGEVAVFPGAYDHAYLPLLGTLVPKVERFRALAERVSGRGERGAARGEPRGSPGALTAQGTGPAR